MRTIPLLLTLLMLGAARAPAEESCLTCHPDVKTDFAQSIHAKDFSCTGCHGGDPIAVSLEAHAPAKGYIGKPSRKDIPSLCASCHADANHMRPFGLPTDQYAQYQKSQHGILLAQGDTHVAVCTDCHGTHRIMARGDPSSPVFPRNIPATCGRCHADSQLMATYNLPSDQLEKFRASVHGVALFVDQHPLAPTCATCHGSHGAADAQNITAACGHCHSRTLEYFDESPHLKAVREGKMSECISCHGYHDTPPPSLALFDTACPTCHAAGSSGLATAQKLKTVLTQAQQTLETASTELAQVEHLAPTAIRFRPRLQQARAHYLEALPVQHALNVERVDDLTRSARSISDDVRGAIHGIEQDRRLNLLWLGLVWMYVLFAVGVAYLYRRERKEQGTEAGRH
jgi:hypothetical protein